MLGTLDTDIGSSLSFNTVTSYKGSPSEDELRGRRSPVER